MKIKRKTTERPIESFDLSFGLDFNTDTIKSKIVVDPESETVTPFVEDVETGVIEKMDVNDSISKGTTQ